MIVGANLPRVDGRAKVCGEAKYVDDLSFPGLLHAKTVRSPVARGRLRAVRRAPSFDWSAVTVVTAHDIPGRNVVSLIEDDQPYLVETEIRHATAPICLVACENRERLEAAVAALELDIEELEPLLDYTQAEHSPIRVYGHNNVMRESDIRKGDLARGFAEADDILDRTYYVPYQEQLYIEPQGMIAFWHEGRITVYGSMQCPYYVHKALKTLFGLPDDRVQVVQTTTGGGFGGKEEYPSMIAGHAALVAHHAKRPVKLIYERQEDIQSTTKRHPGRIRHRTGVTRDGRLTAMEIEVLLDGGAYVTLSPVVLSRGIIHAAGPYRCDNIHIGGRVVATNTPPNGAFRGFGVPQTCFAAEMQMTALARRLGIDPLDFRRRNRLQPGDSTATGQVLREGVGSAEVLDAVAAMSRYGARLDEIEVDNARQNRVRRGLGVSFFFHGTGFTGNGEKVLESEVAVALKADGRVELRTASTDIGQGTQTVFTQILAESMGLDIDDVRLSAPDTSAVPNSGPTVASRTCAMVGKLVQAAGARARRIVDEFAATGASPGSRRHAIAELVRARGNGREVVITERYAHPPDVQWNEKTYQGDAYQAYSWAADIAEVTVDLDTFEVTCGRFYTAHEIGTMVNPVLAKGQIEGGTLQAIGYALLENLSLDARGRYAQDRMATYIVPTTLDSPPFGVRVIELPFARGAYGAKGVGEIPMDGGAPAIAAAVEHALGIEVDRIPVSPEYLLERTCASAAR